MSVKPRDDLLIGNGLNQAKSRRGPHKVCLAHVTQNRVNGYFVKEHTHKQRQIDTSLSNPWYS